MTTSGRAEQLSTRVFETRTATGREHFARQARIVSQIFILLISIEENKLSNVNVVVCKIEISSLPVAVRVTKTRVHKLPNFLFEDVRVVFRRTGCLKLGKSQCLSGAQS